MTSFSFQNSHLRKLFPPYSYGAPGGMIEVDHLKCSLRKTHFHTQSLEETNITRNIGSVSAHLKCSEIMITYYYRLRPQPLHLLTLQAISIFIQY